jgi:hypothetical protein
MFVREEWVLFRTLATLSQKAGVPEHRIPDLVAKELVDNALDEAGSCRIELIGEDGFRVSDRGAGIPGDDAAVASLFSINRPLTSSKLLRLPTRGALGNGLRVVTGAVVATRGSLIVRTRGRSLRLTHDYDTGDTIPESLGPWDGEGTEVEVSFGGRFAVDRYTLDWANMAIAMAGRESYKGKTSPLWYDLDAFHELLQAARGKTLRELVASFEGYAGPKAGRLIQREGYNGEMSRELGREQAKSLLRVLRSGIVNPVSAKKLGEVGPVDGFEHHAKVEGTVSIPDRAGLGVRVPAVVEAWARPSAGEFAVSAFVNRTPITGQMSIYKSVKKEIVINGCGCCEWFGGNHKPFELWFNVGTPYMPIVTDGKAPNFGPFGNLIKEAAQKAARKIGREQDRPKDKKVTIKEVVFRLVPPAVARISEGGRLQFNQRNLYYNIRPMFMVRMGCGLNYSTFADYLTDYENEFGDIKGLGRDPRGTIYHPHTREEIPLGTFLVEAYERPEWLFNKVLFIEKQGLFGNLLHARWPERHDCALMTSKGQGTRAAKDLIDFLAETGEPCEFFVMHDADAAGTLIAECLQRATKARGARNVKIVNLGLEPQEARDMGLEVEDIEPHERFYPVGDYVSDFDTEWLQHHRIELDAMTPARFLEWVDAKFASSPKLVPPDDVMRRRLEDDVRKRYREKITARVLAEARIDDQVKAAMEGAKPALENWGGKLTQRVKADLRRDATKRWTEPIGDVAAKIVGKPTARAGNATH